MTTTAIRFGRDVPDDRELRLCGGMLRLCAEAVAGSDWLSVDPWESMHRRVSVNFTDVAARLRAYLRAHVDPRVTSLNEVRAKLAEIGLKLRNE